MVKGFSFHQLGDDSFDSLELFMDLPGQSITTCSSFLSLLSMKSQGIESFPNMCETCRFRNYIVIYPDGSFFFPKKLWMISFLTKLSCCGFMIHDLLYLFGFVSK